MMEKTTYHRVLRVSAVVCAIVLLFESGMVMRSTAHLSENTHRYLANVVGMSASVTPTELNTLTAELTAQKTALEEREAALAEREIQVELNSAGTVNDSSTYLIATLLFILLVLIVTNYVLDYLRSQKLPEPETKTV